MRIIQRLGPAFDGEVLDNLIECTRKYKGCFNEVWLNTLYGYPSLETHRKEAQRLAVSAKKLRAAGIRVSMQLSNTIGHGEYMAVRDCSALVYEGAPVRNMVGHDGAVAKYAFCWNDRYFRDYLCEQMRIYVREVQPEELWIDDDLRARNHAPVQFGCYCSECIARFNEENGTAFTRETLVDEFLHGDISVREKYIAFIRAGIASLTEEISRAVHETCPKTAIALQNGPNGPYTGRGHDYIFDAMYKVTCIPPMYRPGAGAYNDHDPNQIPEKVFCLAWQASLLPDYVRVICPEIESTPDTALGKSMAGTALESAMNLANGATDLSYAMLGTLPEPLEFYEKGFALFSAQRPYWDRLAEISAKSRADGICYAASRQPHLRRLSPSATMTDFNQEPYAAANFFLRDGVPLTYTESGVYLLHPAMAPYLTDGEIAALLEKNVLTDAGTVEYIQSRGFDMGFSFRKISDFERLTIREKYTDHPLNRGYMTTFTSSFFTSGLNTDRFILKAPEDSEILGGYIFSASHGTAPSWDAKTLTDDPAFPYGYSSVLARTPQGGQWAVMGYGLWKGVISSTQRDRILNIIDRLSGGLSARLLSRDQAIVMSRVDDEGKTLAVSLTNCTVGEADTLRIRIRRPRGKIFRFMSQYGKTEVLAAEETEDGYVLALPPLAAWSVGTVFCDEE